MEFNFNSNHPILFLLVAIVIAIVLAQSFYFLIKSVKRAKKIGMDMKKIKKTMITAAIFTIAPAVSIVISVITLSHSLGVALPWLRLSVIGSLSYETIAAKNAAEGMGYTLIELAEKMSANEYVSIVIVMTLSILVGIWLVPVMGKKIQNGLVSFENRDKRWSDILQNSLFIGMISAFVGFVFCDMSRLWLSENGVYTDSEGNVFSSTSGLIPIFVTAISALIMITCGILLKKLKWKWISDYALPISMIGGMAAAIPLTALLGG